ncbi:MAG: response regulator transcription factor [Ignavibacteriales bacterium]|nr:response regulator transcription factor [Ignavibacteriales bacterium]
MVTLKVLLVDDHDGLRGSLASFLKKQHGVEIIGEAANGAKAIEQTVKLHPDLVLMDYDMPECDGFKATREIKVRVPNTRVVILSEEAGESYRTMAWRSAADGFIDKGSMKKDLAALVVDERRRLGEGALGLVVPGFAAPNK